MPHPYTPAWHTHEDTLERDWLDAWLQGLIDPHTLQYRAIDVVMVPVLTHAGSPR